MFVAFIGFLEFFELMEQGRVGGHIPFAESDDQFPGKQTLESWNPGPLEPFLPTNWEKTLRGLM